MRIIKFRAWDKIDKCFKVPPLNWIANEKYESITLVDAEGLGRFIFLQYTGLKDKNGEEIYEGDVVNRRWPVPTAQGIAMFQTGIVKFGTFLFTEYAGDEVQGYYVDIFEDEDGPRKREDIYGDPLNITDSPEWNVIGNIYENPELLKKT